MWIGLIVGVIVLAIIAVVMLVLIAGSFSGTRDNARDKTAQAALRTGVVHAKADFAAQGNFLRTDATSLATYEPSFQWVDSATPSTGPRIVSVLPTDTTWTAAARSGTTCLYIRTTVDIVEFARDDSSTACVADSAPKSMSGSW
jgi:type II secretory pathway pseudopilin PulG